MRVRVPLLPRHGVYLDARSGDGAKFAEAFLRVWKSLPLIVRRSLLANCRTLGRPLTITLVRKVGHGNPSQASMGAMAVCWKQGTRIDFCSRVTDIAPSKILLALIAHELAHAYQDARGFRAEHEWQLEEDADDHAELWGFDPRHLDEWSWSAFPIPRIG